MFAAQTDSGSIRVPPNALFPIPQPALLYLRSSGRSPALTFTNSDIYAHERELAQLHPDNRHVRDKIRQQLQVLRDAGLLVQVQAGRWMMS